MDDRQQHFKDAGTENEAETGGHQQAVTHCYAQVEILAAQLKDLEDRITNDDDVGAELGAGQMTVELAQALQQLSEAALTWRDWIVPETEARPAIEDRNKRPRPIAVTGCNPQ